MASGKPLTDEQKEIIIEHLCDCTHTIKETALAADCSERVIQNLRKDPEFLRTIIERAQDRLKSTLPNIYDALCTKAKEGSYVHIKLILDHLDRLEEMKNAVTDKQITFKWDLEVPKEDT